MACERYRDALTDVAAGAVPSAGVEAHLASCEACRQELEALRHALALADAEMAGLGAAEPSPTLAARILQAVAESGSAPAWRFGWLWTVTPAAAALLVALAVWVGRVPAPEPRVAVDAPRPGPVIPRDTRLPGPEGSAIPAEPSSPGSGRAARSARAAAVGDRRGSLPERAGRSAVPTDPQVLVPPGEEGALARFAAHLQRRTVPPDSLLVADLSAPLPEPDAIEITPLEIVPLDPAESAGTD